MKKLTAFWRACDRMAAATVMREWELEIRDPEVLAVARHLLIPTDRESTWYPCVMSPRCGCSHDVFTHKDGTKVAVCTCDEHDCDTFPVEAADLVVYELDFARIFRALGKVIGFDTAVSEVPGVRSVQCIGECVPSPSCRVPVYFVHHVGAGGLSAVMHDLALAESGPFILATIALPRRDPSVRQVADHHGVLLLSLDELVFGKDDGTPGIDSRVKTVVDSFVKKAAGESVVRMTRSAYTDEAFVAHNGYHTIILRGEELPPLSDLQAEVARILHEAAKAGTPVMEYAEVACKLADLHAGDLGFEPPEKMTRIFRAGDPRGRLLVSHKRGYFQLNM